MSGNDSLFRRNLLIIAGLHVLAIVGLFLSGFFSKHDDTALWLDGGGLPASQAPKPDNDTSQESTPEENTPAPTPGRMTENPHDTPPESVVVLPTATPLIAHATPRPTPTVTPTPTPQKPTPTPTPKTPTPTATPKRTPSPSPTAKKKTPSPSASPKASASPKKSASPKPSASPSGSATPKASPGDTENNAHIESGTTTASGTSSKGPTGTNPAGSGGSHSPRDGAKNGAEDAARVNFYLKMIHDRVTAAWGAPTSILQPGETLDTIVKIRIEKDGTISNITLEKSSGNSIMDDSVMQAARRLQKVDPLPSSIKDSFYDVPIDIELTPN